MELFNGRPENPEGRLAKETRVYDLLDGLGIQYVRVDHEAAMTMEACRTIDEILGTPMCKNLLLCNRQCTEFYLLLLPGEKPFKTSVVSKLLGTSRLSFADGEYMERFLDISPGSLSVLGLMNDRENRVKLIADRQIMEADRIGCHPCVNTTSLAFSVRELLEKVLPAVGHEVRIIDIP